MNIQAVLFDMGGTIETFSFTRQLRLDATRAIRPLLCEAGIDLPVTDEQLLGIISDGLSRYKKWSIQTVEELPSARVWAQYIFPGVDAAQQLPAQVAEDLMIFIESRYYERAMRPEVPAVLESLQQMGLKMGVISNVMSRGLVPTNLERYGITAYFDPVILSCEYGRRKPDPAIFHHTARLANVPASACLYVGDRVRRDVEGARRAGYGRAVLIRHDFDHGEDDTGLAPDLVIDNLEELVDFVRAENKRPAARPQGKVLGLIFDAGDLLYYRAERGRNFREFLETLGLQISPNHNEMRKAVEYKAYRGQISHDEYREAVVRLYGITQPDLIERGKQALVDDDANVTFFEGVPETLEKLKQQGYLLGIITDTANSLSSKLNWFERGGFGHVWDSIISSLDIGVRKPDPTIYEAALRQLCLEPGEAAFVGHRNYELEGAHAVGMATIAFNYDPDAKADIYIDQFSGLLDAVNTL